MSEAERAEVRALCNSPEHASLAPSQIVPRLADAGIYIASESTFYRVLRAAEAHRQRPEPGLVLGYHLPARPGAG